jgi:hypothetical protein
MFVAAAFLLLLLFWDGVSLNRLAAKAADSIRVSSSPPIIQTYAGRVFNVETVVKNHSNLALRIVGFSRRFPPQLEGTVSRGKSGEDLLLHLGEVMLLTRLTPNAPGSTRVAELTITLRSRVSLFQKSLTLNDDVLVLARPQITQHIAPIDVEVMSDLAVDRLRKGHGTEFAGIRPFNYDDSYHSIDWKATARAGKLMTRETYLERPPAVYLVVDASGSMTTAEDPPSAPNALLSEIGKLLAGLRSLTPIGLVVYNERAILANAEPRFGVWNREKIQRILVEVAKPVATPQISEGGENRTYASMAREVRELRNVALSKGADTDPRQVQLLSRLTLPYLMRSMSGYLKRVRKQGAYKAFAIVNGEAEPMLVIAISNGKVNLNGLFEGAKTAMTLGHQVIVVIVDSHARVDFEPLGVPTLICKPYEVEAKVSRKILEVSRSRSAIVRSPFLRQ